MKKVETKYYFTRGEEDVNITVNEEYSYPDKTHPLMIRQFDCWRSSKDAIAYYEFIIKSIKKIK